MEMEVWFKMVDLSAKRLFWWRLTLLFFAAYITDVSAQDISMCCTKAEGTCRSVCEKMSLMTNHDSDAQEERIRNIEKFCTTQLVDFWICMNHTIEEVVEEVGWWGRACCKLANSPVCLEACTAAQHEQALLSSGSCRRSDEIAFFDCVQTQRDAQWCCSQTRHMDCYEACRKAVGRAGSSHVDTAALERALDPCDHSPPLLRCLRNMTTWVVHADNSRYIPCCHEATRTECRTACEAVLRRTGDLGEISETLTAACGAISLHDPLWQCFLRKDEPADTKDIIPHDVAKLHCCQKTRTTNCRKLCFETFNTGWQNNWQKFYEECIGDPQETDLTDCVEEVESPCSLGCSGLSYCSQMNNRPTELFRSCTVKADLDAHIAVAEQKTSGFITISGIRMPLKNSSQCPTDLWKSVACALHVKPCTAKGHSSLVCAAECVRVVSACVEWSRAPAQLSAAALCARLAPPPDRACVPLDRYTAPSPDPPLLSAQEAITSPCAGAPCNASQTCVVNRNCLRGGDCRRYTCIDGCQLGEGSGQAVPLGWWVRVPMHGGGGGGGGGGARGGSGLGAGSARRACFKVCRCTRRGLSACQPLPCLAFDNCRLHDRIVKHGDRYWVECNACVCLWGERVCARRACSGRLPCACPPHHLPAAARSRRLPNVCLARCAGATDAEIEFGEREECESGSCGRRLGCVPTPTVCLSRLQAACPQHICVNTSNCNSQPPNPVCDTDGVAHPSPCHLLLSGKRFAYWGPCLKYCSHRSTVCGVDGITYTSECAAWAKYVSVDYLGPCVAVGTISDLMEPKCQFDRVVCPPLKKENCQGFTPPGACCPRCGGALRVLYSKKQIDRALYGTNISATVVNLQNLLKALELHVKIAECALRGYLTIETEIFVSIESLLPDPTDLQLEVCVLEAEMLADMINRESPLISIDLGLSALSYAINVHTYPTKGVSGVAASVFTLIFSLLSIFVLR